tara:strand:+ start:311 stop:421 length:111 start_codon:yes stop_codon:yes gene_type:complete
VLGALTAKNAVTLFYLAVSVARSSSKDLFYAGHPLS